MKQLSITEAMQLYEMLSPYLPQDAENLGLIELAQAIIDSIYREKAYREYANILELLLGIDESVLVTLGYKETTQSFIEGLAGNYIFDLIQFAKGLGHGGI